MKRFLKKQPFVFCLMLSAFLGLAQEAWAIFDLNVTPRRGGNHIHFEKGKPGELLRNEEVTLAVTSTLASQYRIYLTFYQPLTDDYGNTIPQNHLIVFSPSNPLGTLRTQLETPVTMGQMPVYTSNAAGDSDEFLLVFNVRVPDDQPGGVYRSQITFTAEPVNAQAGESLKTVTTDIVVEITSEFKVSIGNINGARELNLGKINQDNRTGTGSLQVLIDGSSGAAYTLTQRVSEPLTSQDGGSLDDDAVVFTMAGGVRGKPAVEGGFLPVSQSRQVIYTSDQAGNGDTFEIQYQTPDLTGLKAGLYSGMLSFDVESDSPAGLPEAINIPVKIEIETIFYLEMEIEKDTSIAFGTFRADDRQRDKKVLLTVHSNTGQSYQVSQIIANQLTNEEGVALPPDSFTYYGSDAEAGLLSAPSAVPCKEGESVVYTSDAKGTAEKFTLNYSLKIPKDEKPGQYRSSVKYSITAL